MQYWGGVFKSCLTLTQHQTLPLFLCTYIKQVRAKKRKKIAKRLTWFRHWLLISTIIASCFSFVAVMTDYLPVRIQSEPVLKFNTGVLRCQVPQSAASYTKVISWTRGSARLYPSPRGGKISFKNNIYMGKCLIFSSWSGFSTWLCA